MVSYFSFIDFLEKDRKNKAPTELNSVSEFSVLPGHFLILTFTGTIGTCTQTQGFFLNQKYYYKQFCFTENTPHYTDLYNDRKRILSIKNVHNVRSS